MILQVYGNSEKILGKFIKDKRNKVKIATKVGCTSYFKNTNFKRKTIINNIDLSFKNLKTDYIDVCQLYNPNPLDKDVLKGFEFLKKIQLKGKIKNIGISLQNPMDYLELRKKLDVDMIQCNFNMLDQRILNNNIINYIEKDKNNCIRKNSFGFFTESFIKKKSFFLKKVTTDQGGIKIKSTIGKRFSKIFQKILNKKLKILRSDLYLVTNILTLRL